MLITDIIKVGRQAGQVLNKVLDRIPTKDQRTMDEFFKFRDKIAEECSRADSDMDDMLAWRERERILLETIIKEISRKS